jgi:hypothetical protein
MLVGQARKKYVAPYVNDAAEIPGFAEKYSQIKSPETKKKVLEYLYAMGKEEGVEKFLQDYPEFVKKRKTGEERLSDKIYSRFKKSVNR